MRARKYVTIRIRECVTCGLFFTDPVYETMFGSTFYDVLYVEHDLTTDLPPPDQLDTLKQKRFQGTNKYYGVRLERLRDARIGTTMAEIGSSWGYFLFQAQHYGFEPTGVEISQPRREFGQKHLGVNIVDGTDKLPSEGFDLVYTSHVLEHFTDLSTIFPEMHRILKPQGKLVLEVPHFAFATHQAEVLQIIGAVHPLGFTSDFFSRNLPRYGFRILDFYQSWEHFPTPKAPQAHSNVVALLAEKTSPTL